MRHQLSTIKFNVTHNGNLLLSI